MPEAVGVSPTGPASRVAVHSPLAHPMLGLDALHPSSPLTSANSLLCEEDGDEEEEDEDEEEDLCSNFVYLRKVNICIQQYIFSKRQNVHFGHIWEHKSTGAKMHT